MAVDREREINRAGILGMRLEHLVYNKAKEGRLVVVDRDADLVMAYWSLIFTFCSRRICQTGWWTAVSTDGRVGRKTRATTRQPGSSSISRGK